MKVTKIKNSLIFSILDSPAFGGAEQYMFANLSYLHKKGHIICLATNNLRVKDEINKRLSMEDKKTFKVIDAPFRLDFIGNWKGLVKYFLSLPTAIFWCYTILVGFRKTHEVVCLWAGFSDRLTFSFLAKYFKCKLIWVEIGPLEPTFKKTWGFPKFVYKLTEKFPDHLITTSLFTKKSILKNTNFKNKNITLIYPSIDLITKNNLKNFKKKNNKNNQKIFIVIARLATENEVDNTINAFNLLVKKSNVNDYKNLKLIIVGEGPEKENLQALVKLYNLQKLVEFTGFISEEKKKKLLVKSNFFIFPRAWDLDGFGMATIEAMAYGIPILTADFGPQIEIIDNGVEGYRYKPHSFEDLSKKMRLMLSLNQKTYDKMSNAGLVKVKNFSHEISHKKLEKLIEKF